MLTRTLIAAVAALFGLSAAAADKKTAALREFPFWSAPKQPHARAFVPGLQASLNLTAEQIEKIEAACRDTIDRPEARVKGAGGEAVEKLHKRVAEILTAEQKRKIEKTNDLYAKVVAATAAEYQGDLADAKGDDDEMKRVRERMREALVKSFQEKLVSVLSTDEMKAVETAAAEQKKREETKKDKSK